jgi:hypothetical protein
MTKKNSLGGWTAVLLALAAAPILSTCGDKAAGSCGKVAPCGGDVVGSWTISGACANAMSLAMQVVPNCPTATATASSIHATGSATFNMDLTYTLSETLTVSASGTVPAECLVYAGLTLTCAQFDELIQAYIASDPSMVQSAHCAGGMTCSCSFVLAPQTRTETGTYYTSGTALTTLTNTTGSVTDYCVQKNELHMVSVNTTMPMGPMGQVNIDADTVFTKQ